MAASALERFAEIWINRRRTIDPAARNEAALRAPAVVITGGSHGIGAAIAAEFARRGTHAIVLIARNEAALAERAAALSQTMSIRVETLAMDLAEPGAASRIMAAVNDRGLYVDYLVANAGIGLSGPFVEEDPTRIQALIDLNIKSLTDVVRAALPGMIARGRGGILTIASLGGYVPGPHQALYYASKSFVISLTEALAHEVSGRGLRIAVAAPGPVATTFHETMGAQSSFYLDALPVASAEYVAKHVVRGFMLGRTVIVPGIFEAALAWIVRLTPHPISVPLVGMLLRRRDGAQPKN